MTQGSNWLYRLTSSLVLSCCMLNSQVVADQILPVRKKGSDSARDLGNNDVITIITAIAMVTLLLLFAVTAYIRRRRKAKITPTSDEWKIYADYTDSFTDLNPPRKHYSPSHRSNNSFVTKPTSGNLVSYPNNSYPRNTKNLFGTSLYMDGSPCLSNSSSESYSLRHLPSHSQTTQKLPDTPPSLGDMPKFRTHSDTWDKYLVMMSSPGKLNEAVDYMKRTGHSPHSSRG